VEFDSIPQPALEQMERMQGADLLVGVLRPGNDGQPAAAAAIVQEALATFPAPPRAVLLVDEAEAKSAVEEHQSLPVLAYKLCDSGAPAASPQSVFGAYRTVFGISRKIGVRACTVIASELQTVTPMWIDRLARPVLDMDFDLVAPRYARHKWEGLINRSVLAPLSQALYGRRIQNPLGPDFGVSGRLMKSILEEQAVTRTPEPEYPVASVVSSAVRGNLQICEAQVGTRLQPPTDWMNLSSLIAQVLKPAFLDMERNAAFWQRVRGSQMVPAFGNLESAPEESGPVDAGRLIDAFQLGVKNLQDVWGLVVPPTALLEVRKLSRTPAAQFRMADQVWVSIVYDFALAHRIRTINRDHLLRSFTPLYLGWIASYALEMETAGPLEVEARLDRLARAFEAGKAYLVSRWRWPDRFNP
jgi:glucosylglycerate synthase